MSSPFIQSSKEKLFRRCAKEFEVRGQPPLFQVHLEFTAALALIGNLQLALRHPANTGPSSEVARTFIDGLIDRIRDAGFPANAEMLRLGDDPGYDEGETR
jgi:hypothetical protein